MEIEHLLSPAQREVRDELARRDADERARGERTTRSAMAVAPAVAELLYLLVVQKGARTIAEFGTSLGYSTLHLAAAAARTQGCVYSVDREPEKTQAARRNLERAGLDDFVRLATAPSAAWVEELPGELDFVLIDHPVEPLLPVLDVLCDRVAPHGMLFVDGGPPGYWSTGAGATFAQHLREKPDWIVATLPMHKDQLVATKLAH